MLITTWAVRFLGCCWLEVTCRQAGEVSGILFTLFISVEHGQERRAVHFKSYDRHKQILCICLCRSYDLKCLLRLSRMVNQNKKIAGLITISGAIIKIAICSIITWLPYCQLLPELLYSGRIPPYVHS